MLMNLLPPEKYCKFSLPYLGLALIDLSLSRGESAQDQLSKLSAWAYARLVQSSL